MSKEVIFALLLFGVAILKVQAQNSRFYWIWNKHPDFNGLVRDKGPNMCASMDVVDEKGLVVKSFYSECANYAPAQVCGLDAKPKFHCCNGYEKENTRAQGCTIVKPVKSLGDTMNEEGLKNFQELWTKVDPTNHLLIDKEEDRVATIFVPEKFDEEKLPASIKAQFDAPAANSLFYQHVVDTRKTSSEFHNNGVLISKHKGGSPIRINKYSGGVITANCVRILRPNFMSTDGIIHVTEDIILPMKETDWNIVIDHPQLSKFKEYLTKAKLDTRLQQPGCITIFPPTNDAFDKLDAGVKNLIDTNVDALRNLLLYHMTDCCLCSASVMSSWNPTTLEGERIRLSCADGGRRFDVNDALAVEVDHVARNGVGHVIDKVLIPDSAKTLKIKLEEQGLTDFLELVQEAGLMNLLSGRENITVFAPSNQAIGAQMIAYLKGNKELLKAFVANHITRGYHSTSKLLGLEYINTVNDNKNFSSQLFANVYHRHFGVNNALLVKADFLLANGVLHVTNTTIDPASISLAERMSEMRDISLFWELVEKSGLALNSSEEGEQWTVFAPKNSAIAYLGTHRWDDEKIAAFLQKHIIKKAIFPAGVEIGNTHQYTTEDGFKLELKYESRQLRVNKVAKVEHTDYKLSNGVLYVINRAF